MREFDTNRASFLLDDLDKSSRQAGYMLRFEGTETKAPLVRGVANRAGLFRLGIVLARAALLNNNGIVHVYEDLRDAKEVAGEPVIVLHLTDELPIPKPERTAWTVYAIAVIVLSAAIFAVIGVATVVRYLPMP